MGFFLSLDYNVYLNGKKIFTNKYNKNHEFIVDDLYKNLNLLPKDAIILLNDGKQININEIKNGSKDLNFGKIFIINGIHFFSDSLYKNNIIERKNFPLTELKVIKNDYTLFDLNKYPQKKKNNNITYSIAIFGSKGNNIKYINGFLYFLFEAKDEINLSLFESIENEKRKDKKDNLIDKYYFETKEGNYIFISINIEFKKGFFSDKKAEKIIQSINNEKINFFIFNTFETHFDSLFEKVKSINLMQKEIIKDDNFKKSFLFIEPIPLFTLLCLNKNHL